MRVTLIVAGVLAAVLTLLVWVTTPCACDAPRQELVAAEALERWERDGVCPAELHGFTLTCEQVDGKRRVTARAPGDDRRLGTDDDLVSVSSR